MTENPLDPSPETLQRIRERAYYLWQADGCPEHQTDEYWERARELQAMHDAAGAGQMDPAKLHDVVDEAEIEDNLGEFPDRFSDQGERRQTPMATHAHRGSQKG